MTRTSAGRLRSPPICITLTSRSRRSRPMNERGPFVSKVVSRFPNPVGKARWTKAHTDPAGKVTQTQAVEVDHGLGQRGRCMRPSPKTAATHPGRTQLALSTTSFHTHLPRQHWAQPYRGGVPPGGRASVKVVPIARRPFHDYWFGSWCWAAWPRDAAVKIKRTTMAMTARSASIWTMVTRRAMSTCGVMSRIPPWRRQ